MLQRDTLKRAVPYGHLSGHPVDVSGFRQQSILFLFYRNGFYRDLNILILPFRAAAYQKCALSGISSLTENDVALRYRDSEFRIHTIENTILFLYFYPGMKLCFPRKDPRHIAGGHPVHTAESQHDLRKISGASISTTGSLIRCQQSFSLRFLSFFQLSFHKTCNPESPVSDLTFRKVQFAVPFSQILSYLCIRRGDSIKHLP